MQKKIIFGLAALLLNVASQDVEAKGKTPKQYLQPSETRQEYYQTESGDTYTLFCLGNNPRILEQETLAIMKSIPLLEGEKCLHHFYFKESDAYCSFEHSRKKNAGDVTKNDAEQSFLPEVIIFDYVPPEGRKYTLICERPGEADEEKSKKMPPNTSPTYAFPDSAGRWCILDVFPLPNDAGAGESNNESKK